MKRLNGKPSSYLTGREGRPGRLRRGICAIAVSGLAGTLAACAGSRPGEGFGDRILQAVGLSKPSVSTLPQLPGAEAAQVVRKVTLRLDAGTLLNTDAAGRSLSLLARVYKLRDATAFLHTPYEAFQLATSPNEISFAQDIVEVREVVLTPGVRNEVIEVMPSEARYLAVAALFRSPDPSRWRFAFEAEAAARTGVTLGFHGCAISVGRGAAVDATPQAQGLAGVQCR